MDLVKECWLADPEQMGPRLDELAQRSRFPARTRRFGASFRGRVTWHDACHGLRDLNVREEPRRLIRNVRGLEFVELASSEACCGFGGTFSVKYPEISVAILDNKIESIEKSGVRAVISGDASCLMQIGGRMSRQASPVLTMHLAELLASRESV